MKSKEKEFLDIIAQAYKHMSEFDKGYILGVAESKANDKREVEQVSKAGQEVGRLKTLVGSFLIAIPYICVALLPVLAWSWETYWKTVQIVSGLVGCAMVGIGLILNDD